MSTAAAVEGAARNSHYGASKGAVTAFVRALAVELARHRIRVNSILPGWIVTDMTERSVQNPKFADAVLPRIPARRWGGIDDFGGIEDKFGHDAFGPGDDFFKSFVAFGTTLAHTFKLLAEPLDFVLEMLDRFILASAAFVSTQIPKLTGFIAPFIIDEPHGVFGGIPAATHEIAAFASTLVLRFVAGFSPPRLIPATSSAAILAP